MRQFDSWYSIPIRFTEIQQAGTSIPALLMVTATRTDTTAAKMIPGNTVGMDSGGGSAARAGD